MICLVVRLLSAPERADPRYYLRSSAVRTALPGSWQRQRQRIGRREFDVLFRNQTLSGPRPPVEIPASGMGL